MFDRLRTLWPELKWVVLIGGAVLIGLTIADRWTEIEHPPADIELKVLQRGER